ncbi:RNA-binding protein 39 [Thelohanellus kitauei]|uniref:RNA-binding protein 39 n=1 Tax=Thelohanellus kitauei TaxID=669202 RepID=A0A0C2M8A2_THEKT|nr:RNA-binding protein 39 [Thelohanellus kitauei]
MVDNLDVEALLDEAYKKGDSRKRDDRRDRRRHRDSKSRSRSRSRRRSRSVGKSRDRRSSRDRSDRDKHRRDSRRRSSRDRSSRDRSRRRERPQTPPSNRVPLNEMEPLTVEERDARTIFMRQIPRDARMKDIENFFIPVGKIRDVRMITDRNSHRPKGICYVEFQNIDSVSQAIRMSGERMLDIPVIIQATMAEKNRAAMEAAALAKQYGPTKLYVGALHTDITEPMLKAIFEPFGGIEYIQLQYDHATGESKGFGFVQFKDPESAKHAVEKLNGYELAGNPMKLTLISSFMMIIQDVPVLDLLEVEHRLHPYLVQFRLQQEEIHLRVAFRSPMHSIHFKNKELVG